MKTLAIGVTLLLSLSAAAEPTFCEVKANPKAVRLMPIPSKPNYFFRTFPQAHLISYASDQGNFILDMKTEKQYLLPGQYDPVPLGESVMSVPDSELGMSFYPVSEILSGVSTPTLLMRSKALQGVYQSVGLIGKNQDSELYAVIVAGEKSIVYQRVRVIPQPELKVEEVGEAMNLCGNVDLKLPMVSKDGKEISGIDIATGTTKIWKFNFKTKNCDEVEDLGLNAAKADFSYDNQKIVFHLRGDGSKDTEFFAKAEASMNMGVYAYHRKDKMIYKISQSRPGDNAYYPVYRADGSVVYAVVDRTGTPSFAHAFPSKLKLQALNIKQLAKSQNLNSYLALGQLWNLRCSDQNHALKAVESVLSAALSLDQKRCLSLLQDETEDVIQTQLGKSELTATVGEVIKFDASAVSTLKMTDLKKACLSL